MSDVTTFRFTASKDGRLWVVVDKAGIIVAEGIHTQELADLFAAAPDLLASAEELLTVLVEFEASGLTLCACGRLDTDVPHEGDCPAVRAAASIAKARGKAGTP